MLSAPSYEASHQVKQLRLEKDPIERVSADPYFDLIKEDPDTFLVPKSFVERAPEQVGRFIEWVKPARGNDEGRGEIEHVKAEFAVQKSGESQNETWG